MAEDQRGKRDVNALPTLLAETKEGAIRKVIVTESGFFLTDTGATISGTSTDALKVVDENTLLLQEILVEQKITNAILNEAFNLSFTEDEVIHK